MKTIALFTSLLLLLCACATTDPSSSLSATVTLEPRSGSQARGTVRFVENDAVVTVYVEVTGATPGTHGFHVHQNGDCSAPDATTAGDHFDVGGNPHGAPSASSHHSGDFGNVTANARGEIRTQFTTRSITVAPGDASVVGRAVILHGKPDDLTSQPSGNAGPRVACGVVNLAGMM